MPDKKQESQTFAAERDGNTAGQRPTLPPPDSNKTRLLALSGSVPSDYTQETIRDMVSTLAPDLITAVPPHSRSFKSTFPRDVSEPVVDLSKGSETRSKALSDSNTRIAVVPPRAVTELPESFRPSANDRLADSDYQACITTTLSLDLNPYDRSTTVDGVDPYLKSIPERLVQAEIAHMSANLRRGFETTIETDAGLLNLVGIGQSGQGLGAGVDQTNQKDGTVVDVYENGVVNTESIDPSEFGLQSVDQVGPTRAETLRKAGHSSPDDLLQAPLSDLKEFRGIGETSGRTIQSSAMAQTNGTVVNTGDDPFPSGEPVFIDIETDGLEPSIVWLIGVLDGGSDTGRYMPFTEPEPGSTDHLEAFLSWLKTNAPGRPLVAWNGHGFDFPAMKSQIIEHCPEYRDFWEGIYKFDPLYWARDKNNGNAALPGRSNKLESVATSLGWEPETVGLDGKTVAEVYLGYRREWMEADQPEQVSEPDWERLEAYCEDDVRALATIHDRLSVFGGRYKRVRGKITTIWDE